MKKYTAAIVIATILDKMGMLFHRLTLFSINQPDAHNCQILQKSVESTRVAAFKELYPKDLPDFNLRMDLARLLLKEKKWDKSNKLVDEILAVYTQPDTLSASYAELLGMKAQVLAHQKSDKAESMLKSAVEIKTQVLGTKDPSIAELGKKFKNASEAK